MRRAPRRVAFTLTEMLVATALTLVIMVILTSAFQVGLDTFRKMKTAGDLQEKLRSVAIILRSDLAAPHFGDPRALEARGTRLSEWNPIDAAWRPSKAGFVRIEALGTSAAGVANEGTDSDTNPSSRATGHRLSMTVKRGGTSRGDVFLASFPAGAGDDRYFHKQFKTIAGAGAAPAVYVGEWAEVQWFLEPYSPKQYAASGLERFRLIRKQRVVLPDFPGVNKTITGPPTDYDEVSLVGTKLNTLEDLSIDTTKRGAFNASGTAEDLVLPDVLSFEIKAAWEGNAAPTSGTATEFPFAYLPDVFETGIPAPATGTQQRRIKALQVRVRIWDLKSDSTRQITMIQDM